MEGHLIAQEERYDTRSRAYSAWHRRLSTQRYVGIEAAQLPAMIDLNGVLYVGAKRDAMRYACGANKHGKPLSNPDKQRVVRHVLEDAEWGQWSDREIARHCGVGHALVSRLRRSLSPGDSDTAPRTYRTRQGTVTTMDTRAIGKHAALDRPEDAINTAEMAADNTVPEAVDQAQPSHTMGLTPPDCAEAVCDAAERHVTPVAPDNALHDGSLKDAEAARAASPPRLLQLLEPVAALSTISDREALLLDIPPAWYDRVEQCLDRSVATLNELRSVWQQYRREASDLLQGTQAQTGLVPEVPAEPQRRSQPVPAPRVETEDAPPQPAKTDADYDTTRVFLGKPCRYGHTYGATGQMLRRKRKGDCVQCHRESKRS